MSSSIRLTTSGAPDTPPSGYARIYLDEFNGKIHLKMIRPDGSIEVFGTLNLPLNIENGGTGVYDIPQIGQFLIGTGTGYRLGDIVAGAGVNITKTATSFEISTDISNIELQMPTEFSVAEGSIAGQNTFVVTKTDQFANTVYAGPYSGDGTPTFRFLQVDDIPDLPISKIVNLVETIQNESLLVPTDSADIDHNYDSTTKVLSSTLKSTDVVAGSYGSPTSIPSFTVKSDGRLDAAENVNIAIPHTQITDFTEATQTVVGSLIIDSISINSEYDDYANTLKLHINEEVLITTNISETENTRAPTSQAIKLYVDDLIDSERSTRIAEDNALNTTLNNFLNNAPEVLDTIVEISARFEAVEQAITEGASVQSQALNEQVTVINSRIDAVEADISAEIDTRIDEIERVYNAITAHREQINLTPQSITQEIVLPVLQLSHIMQNSVVAFVDRIGIFEGFDFTITQNTSDQVVLTFTPEALLILDGTEVLRLSYLTKI